MKRFLLNYQRYNFHSLHLINNTCLHMPCLTYCCVSLPLTQKSLLFLAVNELCVSAIEIGWHLLATLYANDSKCVRLCVRTRSEDDTSVSRGNY